MFPCFGVLFRVSPASVKKQDVPHTSLSSSKCASSCLSLKELFRIGSFFQIGAQKGLLILELAEAMLSGLSVTRLVQSRVGFLRAPLRSLSASLLHLLVSDD